MIRILNIRQIRELDAHTISKEPIASIDLMERACRAFAAWFSRKFDAESRVGIVCGTGNNGGDGLGIARLLSEWTYPVKIWIVRGGTPATADFTTNLDRVSGKLEINEITTPPSADMFAGCDVLVDAIFGSGLSRPAEGLFADTIRTFNRASAVKVAVDIPSGLSADGPSSGEIIKADWTVTFQLPKLAFLLPASYVYTGEWEVVDIGLDKQFIKQSDTPYYVVREKDVRRLMRQRSRFDHKGHYGHALIIAGGFGKMGAAVLVSRSALRSGVGLLNVHVPRCGYGIMQTAVPEAMCDVDTDERIFTGTGNLGKYDVVGVGPGIGQDSATKEALRGLLQNFKKGIVLDADALNLLASDASLLNSVPASSILTPHPREFERLVGAWSNDFERVKKQQDLATRLGSVVVVKGAFTTVATPEGKIFFNPTGNPGMATGGTGDVLTGILTGLYAQGYSAQDTAILGVYLHGLAGDLAIVETGMDSMIASDIVDFLPQAFRRVSAGSS